MQDKLKRLAKSFFPSRCLFCNQVTPSNVVCCTSCEPIVLAREPIVHSFSSVHCPYTHLLAPFYYDLGADNAIRRLKFKLHTDNAQGLAFYMHKLLAHLPPEIKFDMIVPVPCYKGQGDTIDHADLIATNLSKLTGIPIRRDLLKKVRETQKQHLISAKERRLNLLGAFAVTQSINTIGSTILLVDDVYTTGSTMDECSATLNQAGAFRVVAIVGAKTRKPRRNSTGNSL